METNERNELNESNEPIESIVPIVPIVLNEPNERAIVMSPLANPVVNAIFSWVWHLHSKTRLQKPKNPVNMRGHVFLSRKPSTTYFY